jgi:hypothetical protein
MVMESGLSLIQRLAEFNGTISRASAIPNPVDIDELSLTSPLQPQPVSSLS